MHREVMGIREEERERDMQSKRVWVLVVG